jgi:hypothetical protein
MHVAVPGVRSFAVAAMPNRTDVLTGHARLKPTVMPATIASPAPTPL